MNRNCEIIVGGQRAGKSFYTAKKIDNYTKKGGSGIVYNLGKQTDFSNCDFFEPLSLKDHQKYIVAKEGKAALKEYNYFKEFKFFRYKGQIYDIGDFNNVLYGKAVKVGRISKRFEPAFFDAIFKKVSNIQMVFDDSKSLINDTPRDWENDYLTRMNHAGRDHDYRNYIGQGLDLTLMYHNLDQIPKAVWEAYNDDYIFTTFKYNKEPDFRDVSDYDLRRALEASFYLLKEQPKYSYTKYYQGDLFLYNNDSQKFFKIDY